LRKIGAGVTFAAMQLDPAHPEHQLFFRGVNAAGKPATLRITAVVPTKDLADYTLAHLEERIATMVGGCAFFVRRNDPGVRR
jgi:hypothetical protein